MTASPRFRTGTGGYFLFYHPRPYHPYEAGTPQPRNLYIAGDVYRATSPVVMPMVALPIIVALPVYVMFAPSKKESLGEYPL